MLIVFNDMITDMLSNKRFDPIVNELFNKLRKLNISLIFITRSYLATPKNIWLNLTHYFVMKIKTKELQQIAFNQSSDVDFQDPWIFIKCVLQNHILFWLLILLLYHIIFYVWERIF